MPEPPELPRDLRETLTAHAERMFQEHYEKWIDEKVPMFDGKTPREAATSPTLRPRVAEVLKDLERQYESALERGEAAFDPSWLRDELDVHESRESGQTPPLAHETVATLAPTLAEVAEQIASRVRRESGGALDRTIAPHELDTDLGLQRFVREHEREIARDADSETACTAAQLLGAHVALRANFELHRRKVFWVGQSLSWALGAS